jgi:hypothetical protein
MTYAPNPIKAQNWTNAKQSAEQVLIDLYKSDEIPMSTELASEVIKAMINAFRPYLTPIEDDQFIDLQEDFRYAFSDFWKDVMHFANVNSEYVDAIIGAIGMVFEINMSALEDLYVQVKEELVEIEAQQEERSSSKERKIYV